MNNSHAQSNDAHDLGAGVSPDQLAALTQFQERHGRYWKSELRNCWSKSSYPGFTFDVSGPLQQLRNELGQAWLSRFSMKSAIAERDVRLSAGRWTPAAGDPLTRNDGKLFAVVLVNETDVFYSDGFEEGVVALRELPTAFAQPVAPESAAPLVDSAPAIERRGADSLGMEP